MERAFHLLDKFGDIVESQTGLEIAEIASFYPERLARRRDSPTSQSATQRFIDDLSEGSAGAPRLGPQLGRHIIIKGEGRPHALVLFSKHHDVKQCRAG